MGKPSFPSSGEGIVPVLVLNKIASVENLLRSFLQLMGAASSWAALGELNEQDQDGFLPPENEKKRRISITQFKSLSSSYSNDATSGLECCLCLCRFEAEEEVSELSCKHFFHRVCLDKWLGNRHSTCPLCRSIL